MTLGADRPIIAAHHYFFSLSCGVHSMSLLRHKICGFHGPLKAAYHRLSRTRSCQNPVIPPIPELFNSNFLDELIPPASTPKATAPSPEPHPMTDALRQFSHRTQTENNAPAYDSTLSATLDAFHKLTYFSWGPSVGELLDKVCLDLEMLNSDPLILAAVGMGGKSTFDTENRLEFEEHTRRQSREGSILSVRVWRSRRTQSHFGGSVHSAGYTTTTLGPLSPICTSWSTPCASNLTTIRVARMDTGKIS
jgi:hypothetical protein